MEKWQCADNRDDSCQEHSRRRQSRSAPGSGTTTLAYSLIGNNSGTSLVESHTLDANGNLIGGSGGGVIDPKLASLANNGGPTPTHALLPGSPAIDAIFIYPPPPAPTHNYQLNGSLSDGFGGPNLFALGGTLTSTDYQFGPNQGLNLSLGLGNPVQYSLELYFRWNALSGGLQKIIDLHNLTSNVGLYTSGNGLQFVNAANTPNLFAANTMYRLVLTRDDATDIVRAYINGTQVWSFVDAASAAVFDGPNAIIRFFQDDNTTGQSESQSGLVDLIRVYNHVLTATEVTSLSLHRPLLCPNMTSAAPYARIRDGDGVNGAAADMAPSNRRMSCV